MILANSESEQKKGCWNCTQCSINTRQHPYLHFWVIKINGMEKRNISYEPGITNGINTKYRYLWLISKIYKNHKRNWEKREILNQHLPPCNECSKGAILFYKDGNRGKYIFFVFDRCISTKRLCNHLARATAQVHRSLSMSVLFLLLRGDSRCCS